MKKEESRRAFLTRRAGSGVAQPQSSSLPPAVQSPPAKYPNISRGLKRMASANARSLFPPRRPKVHLTVVARAKSWMRAEIFRQRADPGPDRYGPDRVLQRSPCSTRPAANTHFSPTGRQPVETGISACNPVAGGAGCDPDAPQAGRLAHAAAGLHAGRAFGVMSGRSRCGTQPGRRARHHRDGPRSR